jgi:hypothetical protein
MRSEKALQCCGLVPVHGISFIYRVDLSLLWDLQAILKYINPHSMHLRGYNHRRRKN